MTLRATSFLFLAAPTLAAGAAGQSAADLGDLLVPIHTAPAETDGTEYGLWAAGPDYKVRFDEGVELYPVLGDAYEQNRPLRWRTESARAGGADLLRGAAERRSWSALRYEIRRGAVIEAYDVRRDGVEQTFTLLQRPDTPGDLVITGRLTTPLRARDAGFAHRELVFASDREPLVRYGRAWAVDAGGDRVAMDTALQGDLVHLRLDGAVLARAAFPLVVDPLLGPVTLDTSATSGQTVTSVDLAAQRGSVAPRVVVAYTRRSSSTDEDGFAIVRNADFTPISPFASGVIYSDVTTAWSTTNASAGYVEAEDTWVLAFERDLGGGRVRVYGQDAASLVTNGGWTLFPSPLPGRSDHAPEVGGGRGATAFVAFREQGSSGSGTVAGVLVDPAGPSAQSRIVLGNTGEVRGEVAITPSVSAARPWLVAWSRRVFGNWQIMGRGVGPTGIRHNASFFLAATGSFSIDQPRIAGPGGRYLLTWVESDGGIPITRHLRVRRLDWGLGSTPPAAVASKTLASGTLLINQSLAYDHQTRSHWALTYMSGTGSNAGARVTRVGFTGGVTESRMLRGTSGQGASLSAVTFARPGRASTFEVAFARSGASGNGFDPLFGTRLVYPANAVSVPYGTSCANGVAVSFPQPPYAGSEFFIEDVAGLGPNTPAFYVLATASAAIDLTVIGMPGCFTLTDPARSVVLPAAANGAGAARIALKLPDSPLLTGDLFGQWAFLAPGANALGVLAHHGHRHQVR